MQSFPWIHRGNGTLRLIKTLSNSTLTNHLQWLVTLWTRPGLAIIHVVNTLCMSMEVNSNSTSKPFVNDKGSSVSPPSTKNPTTNAILEWVHQVISSTLCTDKIDMANTVEPRDIDAFLTNSKLANCSTFHRVLRASPGAALSSEY